MPLEKQLRRNVLVETHVITAQAVQEHLTLLPEGQCACHCPALPEKVRDAFCETD